MTFEEMEKSLKALVAQIRHIEDAQIVQGVLERRSEDRIESLAAAAERTNSSVEKLLQVVPHTKNAWWVSRTARQRCKPL